MPVNEITLPSYTRQMEFWNSFTHALGVLFTLIVAPFALAKVIPTGDWMSITSIVVYLLFMLILYGGSAIYHGLKPGNAKKVCRVLDHNNVFLLVMGSYLPFCWITLRNPIDGFPWGTVIFGVVWGLSITGIILNSINIIKFNVVNLVIQITMGSAIVAAFYPVYMQLGLGGFLTLLSAGVLYWVGAALYAIAGKKNLWLHTVFHCFCLAGSIAMFFAIYCFVL